MHNTNPKITHQCVPYVKLKKETFVLNIPLFLFIKLYAFFPNQIKAYVKNKYIKSILKRILTYNLEKCTLSYLCAVVDEVGEA